nr:MAG TPA: nucelotide kinase [Caudoviricetes sp.]
MNDSAFEEKVDHPSHYNIGRIEVIDFIEDQNLNFNLGNAVKYISRAGKKDPKKFREDLEKAIWYLNRELAKQK